MVVTIVAFGTGGAASSINITLDLDVRLFIDTETLQLIGGDGTKDGYGTRRKQGTSGVGDPNADFPQFFRAAPDQLDPCLYDDVLVFSYDDNDNYTFQLETGNNNETFINWAEVNRFFPNATPQQFVDEM